MLPSAALGRRNSYAPRRWRRRCAWGSPSAPRLSGRASTPAAVAAPAASAAPPPSAGARGSGPRPERSARWPCTTRRTRLPPPWRSGPVPSEAAAPSRRPLFHLFRRDHEVRAAVLRPANLGGRAIEGVLVAEADRPQPIGRDAQRLQGALRRHGPPL